LILNMLMKTFRFTIVTIGFILLFLLAEAQPSSGGGGPAACFPPATPCVPIDGGIGFLVAAGIALGGKKAFQYNQRKKDLHKGQ
jgi:hypothetical protein